MELDRRRFNLASQVEASFAFLADLGFSQVESQPTIVRFRRNGLTVNVYHGRQSYEIGVEVARGEERYSLSELIRSADPALADQYRNPTATTPEELTTALARVADLLQRFGARALRNDADYFAQLQQLGKQWKASYALDVLAEQIRPKAEAAFRARRYAEAAKLYEKIGSRLSPTEQKKLATARKRS